MAAAVAAYCLVLRPYGLELADDGVLLAHMDRAAQGQVPYRDFHVGYGPALYWVHAWAFAVFGPSLGTVRAGLALVHAVRAAWLVRLGTAVAGPGRGAALALVLVAFFLPVAPGVCAPGGIPYPAWYADAVGLGAVTLLARSRPPVLAVGMLWGLAFAFRQNSGLLGLAAAAVGILLAGGSAPDGRRGVGVALGAGLLGGAVLLLHAHLDAMLGLVFVGPLLPLAWTLARTRVPAATIGALVRLGAGFVVVAGAVVGVMVVQAGAAAVWTDFLQIGTDTVETYHVPHPTPAAVVRSLDGLGPARAMRVVGDAAWFAILPAVHLIAASLLATGRIRSRVGLVLVPAAALGYLQLYPRMDFWHLLPLAPASLATAALLTTLASRALARVVIAALVLACLVRFAPTVPVLLSLVAAAGDPSPRVARLDLRWDLLRDERLTRLPEVIAAVGVRPRVAGFPALGIVNFAIGRPSPWRHDYFFPGRPGPEEERRLIADVLRDPPDVVVVLDGPGAWSEAAFAAHAPLVEVLSRHFREERRIGPYRILVPATGP